MEEEHYTPTQTARILSRSGRPISERRIRQMLQSGELEGIQSQTGRWKIPRRAVHAFMGEHPRSGRPGGREAGFRPVATQKKNAGQQTETTEASQSPDSARELLERVEDLSYRLGASESRLQLTEQAESSAREERDRLRAELEEERAERRRLTARLEVLPEPSRPDEQSPGPGESQSPDTRPLWKRIISEVTGNR
jgi:hypothetical protein